MTDFQASERRRERKEFHGLDFLMYTHRHTLNFLLTMTADDVQRVEKLSNDAHSSRYCRLRVCYVCLCLCWPSSLHSLVLSDFPSLQRRLHFPALQAPVFLMSGPFLRTRHRSNTHTKSGNDISGTDRQKIANEGKKEILSDCRIMKVAAIQNPLTNPFPTPSPLSFLWSK